MRRPYHRRFFSLNILFGDIHKYNKCLAAIEENPLRPKKPYRNYEIREHTEEGITFRRLFNKKYDLMVVYPTEENIQEILTNELNEYDDEKRKAKEKKDREAQEQGNAPNDDDGDDDDDDDDDDSGGDDGDGDDDSGDDDDNDADEQQENQINEQYNEKMLPDNKIHGSAHSFYKSVIQNKYIGITLQDVTEFFKRQPLFQLQKAEKNAVNKPILAGRTNEVWSIDHIDLSMYEKKHSYKYVLVVIDVFSRFMFLQAQTNLSARTTKTALETIIERAKTKPSHILLDNGTSFKAEFDDFLNEQRIKHRRTISHRPQSNGIVERANLEVRQILKRLMTKYKTSQWKDFLPQVETFYNNRFHSSIKRTPYQVWNSKLSESPEDVRINAETGAYLKERAKREVAKYKRHEYAVGDLCRVEMQTIFSAVRAKVKAGKRKDIIIWWMPRVFRVSRVIERPADLGLEPNLYELQDVETEGYLCIPTQRYGNEIIVLKQCYASEMMPVDENEMQNDELLDHEQALALNGCKATATDLVLRDRR